MSPLNQMAQMAREIERLSSRVQALERMLSGEADSVTLRCGTSAIVMTKTRITLEAEDIRLKASGDLVLTSSKDISIKANREVVIKGSKVTNN